MNYDLTSKEDRKRFVKRANFLLKNMRTNVSLVDESNRTLNQNSYIHVLCRIMAEGTGTTEQYAKQVYFKEIANPEIFERVTKDPLTGRVIKTTRSTCDLTITEMSKAITTFIRWAAEEGYVLPEANVNEDGILTFASEADKAAFHQAQIKTSKMDDYL